jgi:hypothetical protein
MKEPELTFPLLRFPFRAGSILRLVHSVMIAGPRILVVATLVMKVLRSRVMPTVEFGCACRHHSTAEDSDAAHRPGCTPTIALNIETLRICFIILRNIY